MVGCKSDKIKPQKVKKTKNKNILEIFTFGFY